ncbi:PaaI family thioesterase [Acidiferrimicrobium sp. IK]|uniref:PaaI family thioesterase n=1 Tax=Acidiferrimicrobium sp. IK TaxID=2871700 RepID=UPI0021CB577D|nr:PaaI family thioesterase [Acidiferrimicrobium sp. IK]MCU4185344.1 PaaI family thioesterase [Acidiferrimicrobium sp. IK]
MSRPEGPAANPWSGPESWGSPRERTTTWYDPALIPARSAGLDGLAVMQAVRDGELPPAPIAALLGMRLVEAERGRVVFECTPEESMYNPIGVVHGGVACTLADSAAGCAVHTTLDAGWGYTSIDITVNYLRAVTLDSGVLRATGTVTKPGRRVALAAAEIHDGAGRLVATASSNCFIIQPSG